MNDQGDTAVWCALWPLSSRSWHAQSDLGSIVLEIIVLSDCNLDTLPVHQPPLTRDTVVRIFDFLNPEDKGNGCWSNEICLYMCA